MKRIRIFSYTVAFLLTISMILIPAPPVMASSYSIMVIPTPPSSDYYGKICRTDPAQVSINQNTDLGVTVQVDTGVAAISSACQLNWSDTNGEAAMSCAGLESGSFYWDTTASSIMKYPCVLPYNGIHYIKKKINQPLIFIPAGHEYSTHTDSRQLPVADNSNNLQEISYDNRQITNRAIAHSSTEDEKFPRTLMREKDYSPALPQTDEEDGVLFIEDSPIYVNQGDSFEVRVGLTTQVPSKGASFQLSWEGVTSDNETVHLTPLEQTKGYIVKGDFYTVNGMYTGGGLLQDLSATSEPFAVNIPGEGITQPAGTGTLAKIQFTAQYEGTYTLHFFDLVLSDIYFPLSIGAIDGQVIVGPPVGPTPPLAPTSLRAARISTNEIDLQWTDNSLTEYGFYLERSLTGNDDDFQLISEINPDTLSYQDTTSLMPGTTYYYRIKAFNKQGSSASSNLLEVRTWPLIPYAPSDVYLDTNVLDKVKIEWQDNSPNELGHRIERATDEDFEDDLEEFYKGANADDYTDTTIEPGEGYYYRVFAYNALGDSPPSDYLYVYTMPGPPEAPSDLAIDEVTSEFVKLIWEDNARNEDGFIVERALNKKFDKNNYRFNIPSTNISKFSDDTIKDGNYYFYRVCAYNRHGESDYALSAFNRLGGTSPVEYVELNVPARPTELTASLQGYLQVDLAWEDNEDAEEGYHLERALDVDFTLEVTDFYVSADAVTYSDTSTAPNTTYYYRAYTLNKDSDYIDSESPASNVVAITTRALPNPDDIKTDRLDLSGLVDENGITHRGITINNLIGVKSLDISADNQLLTYEDMPLYSIESSMVESDALSLLKHRVIAIPDKLFDPGENSPVPPVSITQEYSAQIIGPVVELQPSGSIFARPVTIILEYNPDSYPADTARQDLVLAYYDAHADKWVELPSTVNTVGNTVSAEISHFSILGIIKKCDRVVEWWRVAAIIAVEMVLGLLIYIFILFRRRSRY
jgi:hypothetical protein